MIFAIPAGVCAAVGLAGFLAAKHRAKAVLVTLALVWAGFTAAMAYGMATATGWDGLGYFLGLAGISAPSLVGLGLGGMIGKYKREGRKDHAAT
ncbi:hypothetical protein AB3Y40_10220 [Yoonia sp. R2331]|uniref:hypothetical protein n=1 Tax=Yoonia sp. R2331 TaxID=3237238 RepID=UPI0034E5FE50